MQKERDDLASKLMSLQNELNNSISEKNAFENKYKELTKLHRIVLEGQQQMLANMQSLESEISELKR